MPRKLRYSWKLRRTFLIGIFGFFVVYLTTSVLPLLFKAARTSKTHRRILVINRNASTGYIPRKVKNTSEYYENTGGNRTCDLPGIIVDGLPWPDCVPKIEWLNTNIDIDKCYRENGLSLDNSCSLLSYLSTQERYCPPPSQANLLYPLYFAGEKCTPRHNFGSLYDEFMANSDFSWIVHRITSMEAAWINAAKRLFQRHINLNKKRIHIHLGLLKFGIGKDAWSGGPLGELVQWSDVIAALYVMGHDVVVTSTPREVRRLYVRYDELFPSPCTSKSILEKSKNIPFDVIFTDITGYGIIKSKMGNRAFEMIRCLCRVVDSFGTEAPFNHPPYRDQLGIGDGQYNGLDLKLQQFNTMFPHTPDNTFLGFVSEFANVTTSNESTAPTRDIALVYGKSDAFWEGKEKYLQIVKEYVREMHGTVAHGENLPSFVINHGVVDRASLGDLLKRTKIFVGLGFPFEGPAPLEAIQYGAVFLNPKFSTPISSRNHKFYISKPTYREITSQNPYAEQYIGEPYVYTVDINNEIELRRALEKIVKSKNSTGYLPHEFSVFGMLERLSVQIEKQQFCAEIPYASKHPIELEKARWPPIEALRFLTSYPNQTSSCNDVCRSAGLICEPTFFPVINRIEAFQSSTVKFPCDAAILPEVQDTDYPSFDENTGNCYLQNNPKLFSCAGNNKKQYRLCPCRDYIHGQTAICKKCGIT